MVASEQTLTAKQLQTLCINTIRTLAIDAVQKANSGHPGAPMGLAPWPTVCGSSFFVSTPPIRCGPTATASFFRTAMHRCCCTRCCTSPKCAASTRSEKLSESP